MKKDAKAIFAAETGGIYCFADTLPLCRKLLDAGARIIQLRDKHADDDTFRSLAQEMFSLTRRYDDALLIVNDRVDIAIRINADGIHIGQEDENYRQVLARVPEEMIVGVSADTTEQAIRAEQAGATYIGAGSVFPTPTKSDARIIGIQVLRDIVRNVSVPVVAIGGITMNNIRQVMETGVRYCAMISEINQATDISARLRELSEIIKTV